MLWPLAVLWGEAPSSAKLPCHTSATISSWIALLIAISSPAGNRPPLPIPVYNGHRPTAMSGSSRRVQHVRFASFSRGCIEAVARVWCVHEDRDAPVAPAWAGVRTLAICIVRFWPDSKHISTKNDVFRAFDVAPLLLNLKDIPALDVAPLFGLCC